MKLCQSTPRSLLWPLKEGFLSDDCTPAFIFNLARHSCGVSAVRLRPPEGRLLNDSNRAAKNRFVCFCLITALIDSAHCWITQCLVAMDIFILVCLKKNRFPFFLLYGWVYFQQLPIVFLHIISLTILFKKWGTFLMIVCSSVSFGHT